jgi:multiple antibiotic resistance protein
LDQDLAHLVSIFLLVIGALLPIVNPIGSAPMFLAMTVGADRETRVALAQHVAGNSFLLLMVSLAFGNFILRVFGLSVPVVQLAGGLVLCALGWKLLSEDAPAVRPTDGAPARYDAAANSFYPLTMPLTVDPGAIAVAVAIGANHSSHVDLLVAGIVGATLAVLVIAITVGVAYRYAGDISTWLGHTKMNALLRLSAFIVLCIGVQIAWNGVKGLIEQLPQFGGPPADSATPTRL